MPPIHKVVGIDHSTAVTINYEACVGCQMCVTACNQTQKIGSLIVAPIKTPPFLHSVTGKNSENTETTRVKMSDTNCIGCGQCVAICSTGAMKPYSQIDAIKIAKAQGQTMVAVLAPATRVGVAEGMGMPMGSSCQAQLIAALRELGFDYVFENLWGADVTTIQDAKEVIHARQQNKGPIYTSCCPGWINLVEQRYPKVIPQISTCRSPNGIICNLIKNCWAKDIGKSAEDIFVCSIFPCTAKKFEIERKQLSTKGIKDCDIAITTREIVDLLKENQVVFDEAREKEFQSNPKGKSDAPFNDFSGSAYIFGKTGGVTESVVRYIFAIKNTKFDESSIKTYLLWESSDKLQNLKVMEFTVAGEKYRAVVCHGGQAVDELMQAQAAGKLKEVDVVEVMICPNGCIGGGGQPKQIRRNLLPQRAAGLNQHDKAQAYKDCHSNKAMYDLLKKWLPTEKEEHQQLHMSFQSREIK